MWKLRKLEAVFYRTSSGREPVREWLKSLSREDRVAIREDINAVRFEWPLGRPLVDHLRDGIWEVRSRLINRHARVLFAIAGGEIVLLHGFIKKTRTTPSEELEAAARRWKIWQGQHQGADDE
jgi:phage-related protein